jgi:hypothetical protein
MDLYIDVHAHSTSKSGFLFCNPVPDEKATMLERSVKLPRLLDSHMVGFGYFRLVSLSQHPQS